MARLSDEERRDRAEAKATRAVIFQARRQAAVERREASAARAAERRAAQSSSIWQSEIGDERRNRLEKAKRDRDRAAALRRNFPAKALVNAHVSKEAQAQGDYAPDTVPGPPIIKASKEKATSIVVVRNRGGTAIERWQARGDLTIAQIEAISIYARAWRLRYGEQRVTANWSMVAAVRGGSTPIEVMLGSIAQAKETLKRLDDAVFFALPLHYFEIWRNVVIFDEAAGVAGSKLGYRNDRAEAAAKAIVVLMADMIATDMRLGTR